MSKGNWNRLQAKGRVAKLLRGFYGKRGFTPADPTGNVKDHALTRHESTFVTMARARGYGPILRSGWPDFLLADSKGDPMCVEVKSATDSVRPAQKHCFDVLEAIGIPVFIWTPDKPETLTRWFAWEKAHPGRVARR